MAKPDLRERIKQGIFDLFAYGLLVGAFILVWLKIIKVIFIWD